MGSKGKAADSVGHFAFIQLVDRSTVRFQVDLDIQIARRPPVYAMLAFACQPDTITFIHAGGDFDCQGPRPHDRDGCRGSRTWSTAGNPDAAQNLLVGAGDDVPENARGNP